MWDLRSGSKQAAGRMYATPHTTLHALVLCSASPHLLAAAGSKRGVTCYDVRLMKSVQRAHSGKWDITAVSFLDSSPSLCLAAGLDQEVTLAPWEAMTGKVCPRLSSDCHMSTSKCWYLWICMQGTGRGLLPPSPHCALQ